MVLLHVKNKRVEYKFELHAKYTIVTGQSGTGKTKFYDLVSDLYAGVKGVQNLTGIELIPVPTNPRGFSLNFTEGAVYVIDENNLLLHQADSARLFQQSKNYFIIITRDIKTISYLPVTLDNVKEMRVSGAYHTLEQKYSFSDYKLQNDGIQVVVVEDEKSGCKFIKEWVDCRTDDVVIEPAFGSEEQRVLGLHSANNKVCGSVEYYLKRGVIKVAVVFDTLGFAGYIEELLALWCRYAGCISLVPWGSYEAYMLASPWLHVIGDRIDTDYTVDNIEAYCHELYSEVIGSRSKGSLSKCVRKHACQECKDILDCVHSHWKEESLIYGDIGELIIYLSRKDNSLLESEGIQFSAVGDTSAESLRELGTKALNLFDKSSDE